MAAQGNSEKQLSVGVYGSILLILIRIGCEIGKQLTNYSINYSNGGKYPLPQTVIVIILEMLKLTAAFVLLGCRLPQCDRASLYASLKFLLPSIIYVVNNNIYLAAILLVPPPIWQILCSIRAIFSVIIYKILLKREVTKTQFLGSFLIVFSIFLTKLDDVLSSDEGNNIPFAAIVLAAIASLNSVGASVYQETLFKKSGAKFQEQQFWLYFHGMIVACCVHIATTKAPVSFSMFETYYTLISESSSNTKLFLCLGLLFTSIGGLVVAAVLKKLDTVVKEYSSATANMFTAILSAILFPDKFILSRFMVLAMMILFLGIYCYERKSSKPKSTLNNEFIENSESK